MPQKLLLEEAFTLKALILLYYVVTAMRHLAWCVIVMGGRKFRVRLIRISDSSTFPQPRWQREEDKSGRLARESLGLRKR
jgi:hypothetical protein